MRRREFFTGMVLVLVGLWAPVTNAQQPMQVPRIGYLSAATAERDKVLVAAFREGLQGLGYTVGKTIHIEERYAEGRYKRLPNLAAELVALKVDVLVAAGPAVGYAKKSTSTVPIVMRTADPVGKGLVASLAHPGGNITGLSTFSANLVVKRLQILKEAVPAASRVAVLWFPRPGSSHPLQMSKLKAAAPGLGVTLLSSEIKGQRDLEPVLSIIKRKQPDALIVFASGTFETHRKRIINFTARRRLPTIFAYDHWAKDGGLMSYGTNMPALYHRMAAYVSKILRGADPAGLPIEQPTKFSLTVNLKTAKALGITFPPSILLRATDVIE